MDFFDARRTHLREEAAGKRLRDMRKAMNMSQLEVAAKIGVSRTAYIKYESGKGGIPGKSLLELADLFGTTTDYLLCRREQGETARETAAAEAYFGCSKARADLQSLINAMSEDAIEVMLGIAKVFAERGIDFAK